MKICIDTRVIKPGDTFIPVKGDRFNGHDFIPEAIRKGAKVLDVDIAKYAAKYRKKLNCQIIAITGSNGKTTVKDLLYAILSQKYNVVCTHENENNEIGVPLTLLKADYNTDIIIVECGMRKKGDLNYIAKIVRPTHVVITSIGLTHIEFFENQKELAKGKGEIFRSPVQFENKTRHAFINFSSHYPDLLNKIAKSKGYKVFPFKGDRLMDQNLNLCFILGEFFQLKPDQIQRGIQSYKGSKHRLISYNFKEIYLIDDTYNANPSGMLYAMEYLNQFSGRKIAILGDMLELGTFTVEEHQRVPNYAMNYGIELIVTYGHHFSQIKSEKCDVVSFTNRDKMHDYLSMEIKSGDIILCKGSRGLKMEKTVAFLKRKYE